MAAPARSHLTQADVADACSVSRSTVAAVLRNRPSTAAISEPTKQRVLEAVERLGYRPHLAARSLRSGRTQNVALALPRGYVVHGSITRSILEGITHRAQTLGYTVTLSTHEQGADVRTSLEDLVRSSGFDGVLLYGDNELQTDPREQILHEMGVPLVLLEYEGRSGPALSFDNVGGAKVATAHLLRAGRRRIAFIGLTGSAILRRRYDGYRATLRDAGLQVDRGLVCTLARNDEDVHREVHRLLDEGRGIDAVFAATDEFALASIQALGARGLHVPRDVAVVGYDDSRLAALSSPPLTSIHQDGIAMGGAAMDMLHEQIRNPAARPASRMLPVHLVVRRSCGTQPGGNDVSHFPVS